jgi:prepilin-type processing-associated H-X9-DG protein
MEKGRTEGTWAWPRFSSWEWHWVTTLNLVNGVPTTDGSDISDTYDCDGKASEWEQDPGCGQQPRYRYSGACPVGFFDGHVKAMKKGTIKFYKNIYSAAYPYGIW